jgi:hypothetical protein
LHRIPAAARGDPSEEKTMQRSEIMEQVRHIDEVVQRANDVARKDTSVPPEFKRSLDALGTKMLQVRQELNTESDDARIVQSIDALEALGDRAKHACEHSGVTQRELRSAVMEAHSELSNLKHRLH